MALKQKKFYSSEEVNSIIENHAARNDWGFSEALRHIVLDWAGELERVPKVGTIDENGKVSIEYAEYREKFPRTVDPRD